jgi:hypothetical protein
VGSQRFISESLLHINAVKRRRVRELRDVILGVEVELERLRAVVERHLAVERRVGVVLARSLGVGFRYRSASIVDFRPHHWSTLRPVDSKYWPSRVLSTLIEIES